MEELLERSKKKLLEPTLNARRRLTIVMNIVYVMSTIFFLSSERIAEGKFVPQIQLLYYVYIPAITLNLVSFLYNFSVWRRVRQNIDIWKNVKTDQLHIYDQLAAWTSMVSIMFMSVMNMLGYGNPSTDAILTDFALGHGLIVVAVIVIGRRGATVWFFIVVGCLIFRTLDLGYEYQYHYMTPEEVAHYELALDNNRQWALQRQVYMNEIGLNPPKVSRYFNVWFIFIVVSYLTAYFFSGITLDLIKRVKPVVEDIEKASAEGLQLKDELQEKSSLVVKSAHRITDFNNRLEKINKLFEEQDIETRNKIRPILNEFKSVFNKNLEKDYEVFKVNFDLTQNGFIEKIEQHYPKVLNGEEIRYLAYWKLKMTNRDIANLTNKNLGTIRQAKSRIKKKLNFESTNWLDILYDQMNN